jgi:hypothetical protein
MLPSEVGQKAGQNPHGLGAAVSEVIIMLPCVWSEPIACEAAHRTRCVHPIETARTAVATREALRPGSKKSSQLRVQRV